jgi:ATP-dependent Zn protease
VATVLGERVKSVDLTDRYFAHTEIGSFDDDQSEVETASRQFASIVIALAGRATEILVLGEPTTSVGADLRDATAKAVSRFDSGLDPDAPFVALSAIDNQLVPERLREALAESVLHTMAEANEQATRLVAEHRDAIVAFARSLYAARRLAGEPLEAALRAAGLEPRT